MEDVKVIFVSQSDQLQQRWVFFDRIFSKFNLKISI